MSKREHGLTAPIDYIHVTFILVPPPPPLPRLLDFFSGGFFFLSSYDCSLPFSFVFMNSLLLLKVLRAKFFSSAVFAVRFIKGNENPLPIPSIFT